jgi:hypothetical protein
VFVQYPTIYLESGRVAQDVTNGDQMMQLLATNAYFTLTPDSTGQGVILAEPADPASAPPTDPAAPAPIGTTAPPAALPDNVTGRTAGTGPARTADDSRGHNRARPPAGDSAHRAPSSYVNATACA